MSFTQRRNPSFICPDCGDWLSFGFCCNQGDTIRWCYCVVCGGEFLAVLRPLMYRWGKPLRPPDDELSNKNWAFERAGTVLAIYGEMPCVS